MANEPQPEKLEKLNRLEDLSTKDLKTVINKGSHVHLPANWSLIWEKTPGDKAYLIVEGEVAVRKGKESLESLLKEVPAFGEALRGTTTDRLGDPKD